MLAGQDVEVELGHPAPEECSVVAQPVPEVAGRPQQFQHSEAGGSDWRGNRVGEQIGPGALTQHRHQLPAPRDVATAGASQCLAECPADGVDPAHHTVVLMGPPAVGPHDAHGVGVVDHHQRVIPVSEVADLGQGCQVAIHREHAVCDDKAIARVGAFLQRLFQLRHITVCVAEPACLAKPDAVDDAGVVERVGDHRVALVHERLEDAAIRVEAGRVENGVLGAEKVGQRRLQLLVHLLGAADEADRGHPVAPAVEGLPGSREDGRVVGEAKVVVCA